MTIVFNHPPDSRERTNGKLTRKKTTKKKGGKYKVRKRLAACICRQRPRRTGVQQQATHPTKVAARAHYRSLPLPRLSHNRRGLPKRLVINPLLHKDALEPRFGPWTDRPPTLYCRTNIMRPKQVLTRKNKLAS